MTKRKPNIDLLRIVAMYGIILFHHFGDRTANNFVKLTKGFTLETYFYDFINNAPKGVSKVALVMDFCYGHFGNGGNYIFMIITGYFLFGRKLSFSKRVRTVSNVLYALFFHGVILLLINFAMLKYLYPFSSCTTYFPIFTLPNWLSGENMWYLQVYGLFILLILPLLKLFEDKLTQKTHLCVLLTLIFIRFLAYSVYLPSLWISVRILDFIMCYYAGGYFSKYSVNISWKKLILFTGIYLAAFFAYQYYWRYSCFRLYTPSEYSYIDVLQPTLYCILFSFAGFLIFNKIHISRETPSKILANLSSSTMGIYIFHFKMISIAFILADTFWWKNWSRKGYFFFAIIDSIILFCLGFLLDKVRQWTYKRFIVQSRLLRMLQEGTDSADKDQL